MMLSSANSDLNLRIIQLYDRPARWRFDNGTERLRNPNYIRCRAAGPPCSSAEVAMFRVEPAVRPDQHSIKQRVGQHPCIAAISPQMSNERIEQFDLGQHLVVS